jgi:hypothetical protein
MQLCAEDCDTPEEALRKLVLPFFERPNAKWLHSIPTKVGRRSARSCMAWPGALPATLKARAYWPTDGGAPRVEVLRWSGDTLTATHAWRELEAQAYGRPPSRAPPFGPDVPRPDEDPFTLEPLLSLLLSGGDYHASEASVAVGSLSRPLVRHVPPDAMERVGELAARVDNPMLSLPAELALTRL